MLALKVRTGGHDAKTRAAFQQLPCSSGVDSYPCLWLSHSALRVSGAAPRRPASSTRARRYWRTAASNTSTAVGSGRGAHTRPARPPIRPLLWSSFTIRLRSGVPLPPRTATTCSSRSTPRVVLSSLTGRRYDLVSIPLPCGRPEVLAERAGNVATNLVYSDGKVFWMDESNVLAVPMEGGDTQALASRTRALDPGRFPPRRSPSTVASRSGRIGTAPCRRFPTTGGTSSRWRPATRTRRDHGERHRRVLGFAAPGGERRRRAGRARQDSEGVDHGWNGHDPRHRARVSGEHAAHRRRTSTGQTRASSAPTRPLGLARS